MQNLTLNSNHNTAKRLTALWAFSESGLGGVIHALKLPFSGFILAALAVAIMSLLANNSANAFKQILKSTLVVLMVKAMVSPHSPWPAYIAVSFQGLMGAIFYGVFKVNALSNMLVSAISLVESATQKIILTTLIFGKSFWQAINGMFDSLLKDFHLGDINFSWWIIITYVSIYTLWGIVFAIWLNRLPMRIDKKIEELNKVAVIKDPGLFKAQKSKVKKYLVPLFFIAILLFIIWFNPNQLTYIIARSILVMLALYLLIGPVIKYVLLKIAGKSKHKLKLEEIINYSNEFSELLKPSYHLAQKQSKGLALTFNTLVNFIVLTVYHSSNEA